MLVAGDQRISEIAYQLSSEDTQYFSRPCRKKVGLTPMEHKNQLLRWFNPNPTIAP